MIDPVYCPACDAEYDHLEASLGWLGTTCHYRCRDCGAEWHETEEREPEYER